MSRTAQDMAELLAERNTRRDDVARIGTDPRVRPVRTWEQVALQRLLLRRRERAAEARMREAARVDGFRPRLFWGAVAVMALLLVVARAAGVVIE